MLKYASHLKMWKDDNGATFAEVYETNDTTFPIGQYIFPPEKYFSDYKANYPDAFIIANGLENLLVYSSVFSSAIDELGAFNNIGSVVDSQFFTDKKIIKAIKIGQINDFGNSSAIAEEKLIVNKPSAAIVSVYDGLDISSLARHNIPIVYMADNLEADPLGRAEWIKFLAYLVGKPEVGDSIFSSVEKDYKNLKKSVISSGSSSPKVMVENMYQGIWYVPGGKSYAAKLIEDAGGDYIWKDNTDFGSLSLSMEDVIKRASNADVWIMRLFGEELTAESLKSKDERYMNFAPVKKDNVWYSNTEVSGIFDEFPYHPERLLKDYIYIFNPGLNKDNYSPRYFKKMRY